MTRIYVDGQNGSDNNSGSSWDLARRSIEAGLSGLSGMPGVVIVSPGVYTAPPSGYEVMAEQSLQSFGSGFTKIIANTLSAGKAAISIVGGRSFVNGFWLAGLSKVGVRVTDSQTGSTENVIVRDILVALQGEGAIAFGIGDNTSGDVSEVALYDCASAGDFKGTHMQIGNGTTGNVLDVRNFGGNSQCNRYGLDFRGGSLDSEGLNFAVSANADIRLYTEALGTLRISGGRSESALRFIDHANFGAQAYHALAVENYIVLGLTNTDGQGIQTHGGVLRLQNVRMFGATCPQYLACLLAGQLDRDVNGRVVVEDFVTDHPFPIGGSPYARKGKIIDARNVGFVGDTAFQMRTTRYSEKRVRRIAVKTAGTNVTLDSHYADEFIVGLEANAGTVTLTPGALGQRITIVFEQNGIGQCSYSWPVLCSLDSPDPIAVDPFDRQRCEFEWDGNRWAQVGPMRTAKISPLPFAPVTDNFTIGNPYWLDTPSTPNGYRWEHVPGGGSLGVRNGMGVCSSVGWIGDNDFDLVGNGAGLSKPFGAGAVIETGGDGVAVISATFKIGNGSGGEGVIAHYRDDQTFWVFRMGLNSNGSAYGEAHGWSHGMQAEQGPRNFTMPPGVQPGSEHTLTVKCLANGFVVTVDTVSTTMVVTDIAKWKSITKHGVIAGDTTATRTAFSVQAIS